MKIFRLCIVGVTSCTLVAPAWGADTPGRAAPNQIVGIYDSRAVAFAHFWSEPETKLRNARVAEAKAAKSTDPALAAARSRALGEQQARIHLEVFSTAPATEALAALQDRLPAIQEEVGVTRLVSKWDEETLRDIPAAQRVDVTTALVRAFNVPAARQKTLDELQKKPPLPLAEARKLQAAGKL